MASYERIYTATDLESGTTVFLDRHATPWTSWDVIIAAPSHDSTIQFDSLIDATAHLCHWIRRFVDNDAPTDADTVAAVAAHFDDPMIYPGEDDERPFLVNEYEWDDEEEG